MSFVSIMHDELLLLLLVPPWSYKQQKEASLQDVSLATQEEIPF